MTRAAELLMQMSDSSIPIPRVPTVEAVFAQKLAEIEDRLTASELDDFVRLGALIRDRSTLLVPVWRADIPETWPTGNPIW